MRDTDPGRAHEALRRGMVIAQDSGNRAHETNLACGLCGRVDLAGSLLSQPLTVLVLGAIFAAETARAEPSTRRVAVVSGEIRQTEQLIVRLVGSLVPDPDAVLVPKARQHQAAARPRWDSRSHRRVSA